MKTASEYRATAEDASDGRAKHGGGDGCCGVSGRKPPEAERHREDHFLLSSCWQPGHADDQPAIGETAAS